MTSQRNMTAAQAAEFMGVSVAAIRVWYRSGRLTRHYDTAKPSFLVSDLIELGENAPNFPPDER